MDPIAKGILNSLKCPICGGQIDLISWSRVTSKPKEVNFSCVHEVEHYGIWFVHWEQPIRIEMEQAVAYEGRYQYKIKQYHYFKGIPNQFTNICIRETDKEYRILDNVAPKEFHYDKHLFDFKNTNRTKLINRIKTILTFQ